MVAADLVEERSVQVGDHLTGCEVPPLLILDVNPGWRLDLVAPVLPHVFVFTASGQQKSNHVCPQTGSPLHSCCHCHGTQGETERNICFLHALVACGADGAGVGKVSSLGKRTIIASAAVPI
jgi:hypothetical protein